MYPTFRHNEDHGISIIVLDWMWTRELLDNGKTNVQCGFLGAWP